MAYVYNNTNSGFDIVSDKIKDILTADPNGMISTDFTQIEENNFLTPTVENRNRFAWDILKELVALGNDTDDSRRLLGVYAGCVVQYITQPTAVEYLHRLTDRAQRITTPEGGLVYPWDVLPAKWLFVPDFLVGRPQSSDLKQDPRAKFIEAVTFTAPFTVSLRGAKTGTLDQLLAKISYSGGIL